MKNQVNYNNTNGYMIQISMMKNYATKFVSTKFSFLRFKLKNSKYLYIQKQTNKQKKNIIFVCFIREENRIRSTHSVNI